MQTKTYRLGFTLVEMLVVVAIIGVLAALALVSFSSAQKQARDAQRKSDLKQYQAALAGYAAKNGGKYPAYPANTSIATLCPTLSMVNCILDPKDGATFRYYYQANKPGGGCANATACATQYTLRATLENESSMLWIVCSTGNIEKLTSSTNFDPNGACPVGVVN